MSETRETSRIFIAVPPPEAALAELTRVVENLRRGAQFTPCPLRWVKPSGLHVTLWFLGALDDARIEAVKRAMDSVEAAPLLMEIKQFGVFPHWRSPSVLWAGVRDRGKRMALLHAKLAVALAPLGIAPEARAFHPHITLAYFKGLKGTGPFQKIVIGQPAYKIGPFEANEFVLYRSSALKDGAEYEGLHKVQLTGAAVITSEPDE